MWQRFNERARKVIFYAQEEAAHLGESSVATEHLLLGLVREHDGVAVRVLERLCIPVVQVRNEILRQVVRGNGHMGAEMRLMPNAKQVIDNAFTEAKELDHHYIGTEHILLGLIRDDNGLGGKVLRTLGASHNRARAELAAYNLSHHRHRHAELDQNENLLQSQSPNLRSFLYTLGNVLTRVSSRERMSFTEDDIRELDQHLKPG